MGYLSKEGLGDDVGILLQSWVADSDKCGHRGREKTDLERVKGGCKHTSVVTVGSVEAYKNEDGICTFLPNLHTFLVQLLSPGGIHIEDGSGRGAETGLVRSGASGSIIGLGRHDGNENR